MTAEEARALGALKGPPTKREEIIGEAIAVACEADSKFGPRYEAFRLSLIRLSYLAPTPELLEYLQKGIDTMHRIEKLTVAEYARVSPSVTGELDVLERYVEHCLNMPSELRPTMDHIHIQDDYWSTSTMAWEVLQRGLWKRGADNVEAYVRQAINFMFYERVKHENHERDKAADHGVTLQRIEDLATGVAESVTDEAQEDVILPSSISESNLARLPEKLRICYEMLLAGAELEDIAKAVGTDTSHIRQNVKRLVERFPVPENSTWYKHFNLAIHDAKMKVNFLSYQRVTRNRKGR